MLGGGHSQSERSVWRVNAGEHKLSRDFMRDWSPVFQRHGNGVRLSTPTFHNTHSFSFEEFKKSNRSVMPLEMQLRLLWLEIHYSDEVEEWSSLSGR